MPACGPPSSLSPLNATRSAPAARLARTDGSSRERGRRRDVVERRASRCRDPRTAGPEAAVPSATRSPSDGRSVKPSMRKFDGCTRRMQRRAVADRGGVVGDARAVRRADLAQRGARLRQDVGHAEAAADLDQLAARDDDFAAGGERRQHEQRRRGVVVDDERGLGAGERDEQALGVHVPVPARARGEVVLEVRIAGARRRRRARARPARAARGRGSCAG